MPSIIPIYFLVGKGMVTGLSQSAASSSYKKENEEISTKSKINSR